MCIPKLLVPSIAVGSCFAPDLEGKYYFVGSGGGGGGGYGVALHEGAGIDYYCLLGILNSSLLSLFLRSISTPFRGGYIALNRQYIEQLPIMKPSGDVSNQLQNLVKETVRLYQQLATAKSPPDKEALARQILAFESQIDGMVCELYGVKISDMSGQQGG